MNKLNNADTLTYAMIELPTPILCAKDALGQTAEVYIGSCKGVLIMPSLPSRVDSLSVDNFPWPLSAPSCVNRWPREGVPILWGRVVQAPVYQADVERVLIEFQLDSAEREVSYRKIYADCQRWMDIFMAYVPLMTKQGTYPRFHDFGRRDHVEILESDADGLRHIDDPNTPYTVIEYGKADGSLHLHHLTRIASLSSLNSPPKLEYQLMLGAYRARMNDDYRVAAIEAAVAMEVALAGCIRRHLDNLSITFAEGLLNKYQSLSGKLTLAKLVGLNIPRADYLALVANPRNLAAHQGRAPDAPTLSKLIAAVENFLDTMVPDLHDPPTNVDS